MTNLTKENLEKIAKLAKIKINDQEKNVLIKQLGSIINWIDILSELDTENVEILNNIHNQELYLFEDEVEIHENIDDIMKTSDNTKYNYYCVPKMIQ